MSLESFIQNYGYAAVLVGTFFEGETVLILAGLAAHLGYLKLSGVILAAVAGSFAGDQLMFFLGRVHGQALLDRHPAWRPRVERVHALLERYHLLFIPLSRFFYGLRYLIPFAFGTSRISVPLYLLLDGASVLVWAVAVAYVGYLFGNALETLLGNLKRYELIILGAIAVAGILIRALHFYRQKRRLG